MKTNIKYFLINFLFIIYVNISFSQTYINKVWATSTAAVHSEINRTSSISHQGRLYVTSNVLTGDGDTDVLTIAYTANGDTLWAKTQAGSLTDGNDYGINLTTNPAGDIVVIATIENAATDYDYAAYQYDADDGTLQWSYTWNGVGNAVDIPSSVACDPSGNVYLSGGTEATSGTSDFGIVKLSPSGSFLWNTYYDYAGYHDGATSIVIQNKAIVSGGSCASLGDWDIATLKLDLSTGSILTSNRTDVPEVTMAEATAMKTDSDNTIYITGFSEIAGN